MSEDNCIIRVCGMQQVWTQIQSWTRAHLPDDDKVIQIIIECLTKKRKLDEFLWFTITIILINGLQK